MYVPIRHFILYWYNKLNHEIDEPTRLHTFNVLAQPITVRLLLAAGCVIAITVELVLVFFKWTAFRLCALGSRSVCLTRDTLWVNIT